MSPLGNWRRRERGREEKGASAARNAHLHRGWMLTIRVDEIVLDEQGKADNVINMSD